MFSPVIDIGLQVDRMEDTVLDMLHVDTTQAHITLGTVAPITIQDMEYLVDAPTEVFLTQQVDDRGGLGSAASVDLY
jgi:hypothetical protein